MQDLMDYKKRNDVWGLQNIDKIQDAISREFSGKPSAPPPLRKPPVWEIDEALRPPSSLSIVPEPLTQASVENSEPPPRTFRVHPAVLLLSTIGMICLGLGIGVGLGVLANLPFVAEAEALESEPVVMTSNMPVFETTEVGTIADMLEILTPAVVGITTIYTTQEADRVGHGSGIIFDECDLRIFIVTNRNVIAGGIEWLVSIDGHEPLSATPVGSNIDLNLTVMVLYKHQLLEIGIYNIVIASFGDAGQMRVGDTVLAIGNAMGDGTSVTLGVISAAENMTYLPGRRAAVPVLQTDAALNYGLDGGPLINTRGEIVGINLTTASTGAQPGMPQFVEGMGFSLSINAARDVIFAIAAAHPRAAIGITGGTVNDELAASLGIPPIGVYVSSVSPGGGAYNAGLLPGDVITGFEARPIFNMSELVASIRARSPGDVVQVNVLREGQVLMFDVVLGILVTWDE